MANPVITMIEFYGDKYPLWPHPLIATVTLIAAPYNSDPVSIYDKNENIALLFPGQSVRLEHIDISKIEVYGSYGSLSVIGQAG